MRFDVLEALRLIHDRWPTESGKIIERLLAISFDSKRAGYRVESKSIQGVDIGLVRGVEKYALEVKTTSGLSVKLEEKDIKGLLEKAENDQYIPCVAALKIDLLQDWVIARAGRITPGEYTVWRLALDSMPELETIARVHFERVVLEHAASVLNPPGSSPLKYLGEVLERESHE